MIKVGDTVRVLDHRGQHYEKIIDTGRVTRVTKTRVWVRLFMPMSPDYFALTFPANRVKLAN